MGERANFAKAACYFIVFLAIIRKNIAHFSRLFFPCSSISSNWSISPTNLAQVGGIIGWAMPAPRLRSISGCSLVPPFFAPWGLALSPWRTQWLHRELFLSRTNELLLLSFGTGSLLIIKPRNVKQVRAYLGRSNQTSDSEYWGRKREN